MKTVKNKYTGKLYKVIGFEDKKVMLEREEGSRFVIDTSEYRFYYTEVTDETDGTV